MSASSTDSDFGEQQFQHRRRHVTVASILDAAFGQLVDCNPDLWERRTYLMFIGTVYERLATCRDELSTDDLATLAKALAENRRAELQSRKAAVAESDVNEKSHSSAKQDDTSTTPSNGHLPNCFADTIRQVYGTALPSVK